MENMRTVLDQTSYPSFMLEPTSAVLDGSNVLVYVTLPILDLSDASNYVIPGGIVTQVRAQGGGIMNVTQRSHIVYPGIIIRQLVHKNNGIYIQTHGIGYNFASGTSTSIQRYANSKAASANDVYGPAAFKALDRQAINYFNSNF
jgi:hypothetical protein